MSNRMIKDSMLSSDKIASLSDFEFRLWIGLILCVDDVGRGDARPAIIKGRVFPLRERVSMRDIEDALHGLAAKGCISLYTVDGKSYFWFPTWGKHQRIRDVKPKYPGPNDKMPLCDSLRQTAADCGGLPPETKTKTKPNQTETETKDEDEPRAREGGGVIGVVEGRLGGGLTQRQKGELAVFIRDMGEECVVRALDAAQDAGQLKWSYVRGTLLRKQAQGVQSAEDWDKAEASFQAAKGGLKGTVAGTPRCVQPSPERAKQNSDWLEEFLAGQEGKPC